MEEKAVLRVRDRISAALTVPYVRRAVWLMAGGLASSERADQVQALNRAQRRAKAKRKKKGGK